MPRRYRYTFLHGVKLPDRRDSGLRAGSVVKFYTILVT